MKSSTYDKAKWHSEGNFPSGLPPEQGSVHCGIYLAWLGARRLLGSDFEKRHRQDIERLLRRELTGPELFRKSGGWLAADMLSAEGDAFTGAYYERRYMDDYFDTLGAFEDSVYHVQDSWVNYDRMAARLDERFAAWTSTAG